MFKRLSLKVKIIVPIIFTIVLGVTIILYTILSNFTCMAINLSNDVLLEKGHRYSQIIGNEINAEFLMVKSIKSTIEEAKENDIMNREDVISYLQKVMINDDNIIGVFTCWEPNAFDGMDKQYAGKKLHDDSGRFIPYITRYGNRELRRYEETGYGDFYLVPKRTKTSMITEPYKCEVSKGRTFYMVSVVEPLIIDNEFVGVVGVDILLEPINQLLTQIDLFDSGYAFLLSSEGEIASFPDKRVVGKVFYDYAVKEASDKIKAVLKSGEVDQFVMKDFEEDKDIMVTIVPLKLGTTNKNWGVGVAVPKSEVLSPIILHTKIGIILGVIVVLIILLLLFFIINSIVKKIFNLNNRLTNSSNYVLTASTQLALTSQELADGANEQAASIEETSATMEETASMARHNEENTKTASKLFENTKDSSMVGADKMNHMVKEMDELKISSNQISKIIKVIEDIAFQTNILALNAAVEAARAGDAGQGFAVVAEEVRNLARKSAEAAKNTTHIIDKNIQLSNNGLDVSVEVENSLEDITTQIEKVNTLIAEISLASSEQNKGIQQVTNVMGNMEEIVQNNAAVAEESAAAAEELKVQSSELEVVVKELTQLIKGCKNSEKNSIKSEKVKKKKIKENRKNKFKIGFNFLKKKMKKKEIKQIDKDEEKEETETVSTE